MKFWKIAAGCMLCQVVMLVHSAGAQTNIWKVIPPEYDVSFGKDNKGVRLKLTEGGLAFDWPTQIVVLHHHRITLATTPPEPGRFEVVVSNPKSLLKPSAPRAVAENEQQIVLEYIVPEGIKITAAERLTDRRIEKQLERLRKKAADEAKGVNDAQMGEYIQQRPEGNRPATGTRHEKFIELKARELLAAEVREELQKLAKEKPEWLSPEEKQLRQIGADHEFLDKFRQRILQGYRLAEAHYKHLKLGQGKPVDNRQAEDKLDAICDFLEGRTLLDDAAAARFSRILGREDSKALRDSLATELAVRFYPQTDPTDANAQWFNAQRVGCPTRKVAEVIVRGNFDPAGGDWVDWWLIDGYQTGRCRIELPSDSPAVIDQRFPLENGLLLRLVAADKKAAAAYSFEVVPLPSASGSAVEVFEAAPLAEVAFPY